jgi:hypothetical protein
LQAHKEDGFRWWVQRLSRMFQLHDEVRIDHFRGFAGGFPLLTHCCSGHSSILQCFRLFCAGSSLCKGLA